MRGTSMTSIPLSYDKTFLIYELFVIVSIKVSNVLPKTRTKFENHRIGRLLRSSIFVIQKAAAPKNGEEFRQRPIGDVRRSLATSHDVWRRHPKLKTY